MIFLYLAVAAALAWFLRKKVRSSYYGLSVVSRSKPPKLKTYKSTCQTCTTVFEYNDRYLDYSEYGSGPYVRCPHCGAFCWLSNKEAFACDTASSSESES